MKAEAVFFDKDGTLLDFDAFWIPVTAAAVRDILHEAGADGVPVSEVLDAVGIRGGTTDPDGLICRGTYHDVGMKIREVISAHGISSAPEEIVRLTDAAFTRNVGAGEVRPVCGGLRGVLSRLKARGIRLLVVTTDNPEVTRGCLEKLGIADLFDRVIADDGIMPPKPDPQAAAEFIAETGISPENAVMVGDTMTDINFARNAGIHMIYVGKDREAGKLADAHIPDVSHILELIGD